MVRIDQALYERIARMAAQHRRSIRAQTSLLLERALDGLGGLSEVKTAGDYDCWLESKGRIR